MKILKLEAIRGFVALYVVIHHFILFTPLYGQTPNLIKFFFRFGREAVLVFFLLSGFVICLSFKKGNESFSQYFEKRFLRIYPILIATFLLSAVIYYINGGIFSMADLKSLIANSLQLQRVEDEPGQKIPTFLGNLPLWSLSYEWWFYMAFFPIYLFFKKIRGGVFINDIYIILTFSVLSWVLFLMIPGHFSLVASSYLLWWSGFYCAEIYRANGTFSFKYLKPVFLSLAIMAIAMGIPILKEIIIDHKTKTEVNADFPITNYWFNYIEAFIIIFFGLIWWKIKLFKFDLILGWFAKLAPISYAIYVVHFPILQLKIPFIGNLYLLLAAKFILIIIISYILELPFQSFVIKKYKKLFRKPTVAFASS